MFFLAAPAGIAAAKLARHGLNKVIEAKIKKAIIEARLEATEEATKGGLKVIREKIWAFVTEKFQEGIVLFLPIGAMLLGWIEPSTAGYLALAIYLLILFGKLQQKIENTRLVFGVIRREGLSPKKIVASFIYKKVYEEVVSRAMGETSKLVPRVAIFFSKHTREDLAAQVASEVATVASNVSATRVIIGSISTIIGAVFALVIYIIFYQIFISPYIFQSFSTVSG